MGRYYVSEKYEVDKSKLLLGGVYQFAYDEDSKGVCPMDGGFIPEKEEIIEVAKGLINFVNSYSQKNIDQHNKSYLSEERIGKYRFRKRTQKKGYIFIYRELGTNLYRIGETKELQKRMIALNNASPVTIELICSDYSEDVSMLKEYLQNQLQSKLLHDNWYRLEQSDLAFVESKAYKEGFDDWLEEKERSRKKQRITCIVCGKTVTELESNHHYRCGLCNSKFCSEECGYSHTCSPL